MLYGHARSPTYKQGHTQLSTFAWRGWCCQAAGGRALCSHNTELGQPADNQPKAYSRDIQATVAATRGLRLCVRASNTSQRAHHQIEEERLAHGKVV